MSRVASEGERALERMRIQLLFEQSYFAQGAGLFTAACPRAHAVKPPQTLTAFKRLSSTPSRSPPLRDARP